MKKNLFFIGTLCDGGAERVVSILSRQMAEQGMDVEILTYYDKPIFYEIHPKVIVNSVEKKCERKNLFQRILWLRKYFKENAKIVISFLAPFNMIAIAANIGNQVPIIVADRNDPTKIPTNEIFRKARNFLYMFADGVVLQTEKNRDYFNGVVKKKSRVIYNPVNLKEPIGSALDIAKEKKIVSVGRLMPQKNQEMLLKAFAEVAKHHPDYIMTIYGEGPQRETLEKLSRQLGIAEKVYMPGSVTDVHRQIKSAELFVLSSDYEGMPNALIEAMCLGLPVISTKVSGATDLIESYTNGILVNCGNIQQLSKAMIELLDSSEMREAYATENAKRADQFNVNVITKDWITYIDSVCANMR